MNNHNLKTARSLTKIGAIIGIVLGVIYVATGVGILWAIPMFIGSTRLLKYVKSSDKEFVEKRSFIWRRVWKNKA